MSRPSIAAFPRRMLLTGLIVAHTGCAQIPSLGQLATPKDGQSYAASQSFAGQATHWPDESWWQAYGDKQLDALIQEA